jgi:RimJ/RimL family protein N-acetyltransferase
MSDFYLETERLVIRNWKEEDRELFHLINSDDRVMQYFPFRRTREQSDIMFDELRADIAKLGYGYTAVELKETGECLGFCGLHHCNAEPVLEYENIEIGWRLAPQYWGKGYITEAAFCLLQFGFEALQLDEIISFAVYTNEKSLAVMERIGMTRDASKNFDHPRVPDTHPELKRHSYYAIQNPNKKGG